MKNQGRKEVAEAVLVAIVTTIAASLVQWGVGAFQQRVEDEKKKRRKAQKKGKA